MSGPSKARRERLRARRQAEAAQAARVVELRRAAGHSCADCRHLDHHFAKGTTCALGDEWDCYQPTTPDNLCWQWEAKP